MSERAVARDLPPVGIAARRWPVLAACMMAVFMAAVESTIVATAMPTIVADLGGFHLFSWVFAVYLLTLSVTIPVYGRLSDLYGRKRVFYAGAGLFLLGSTLCGFARGMAALVAFRALQGLGAGAIQPTATTIVGDIYPPAERARIQGWISAVWGVAAIIGPALGAFLVERVTWSAVFWVNLPVGAAAMAMFALFLRERPQRREQAADYLGSCLMMAGAGALMLAVVEAGRLGGPSIAGLVLAGLLALALFAAHERRAAAPMFPLELWRSRVIVLGNLGGFAIGATMMGVSAFLPTYVQGVMGRSAEAAGFVLANMSVSWTFASIAAGRLMVRTSYRASAVIGSLALIAGSAVLIALEPARGPLWAGAGAFLIGVGMGFCNTSFLVSTQASVGWHIRGLATSSLLFMRMVGQALGAAGFGALLNLGLYRRLSDAGDAVDRLMDPALRHGLGAAEIGRLTGAIATSLHAVWLLGALLALATLVIALALPPGLSPTRPANAS